MSRMAIHRDFNSLHDELNVVRKIEKVVSRRPMAWLAGAALTGFVAAGWRRGPAANKKSTPKGVMKSKRGKDDDSTELSQTSGALGLWAFLFATFKMLMPVMRPIFSAYASKRMAEMAMSLGRR